MDALSEHALSEVYPGLAALIRQITVPIRVIQGLRSWEQQAKLYAQGRTTPGEIVTKALPGHSWHEFGLAVDVVPLEVAALPKWAPDHPIWKELEAQGRALGMVSGADWTHIVDQPHFQLTGRFPVSPDDEVRSIYASGALPAVWASAFPA